MIPYPSTLPDPLFKSLSTSSPQAFRRVTFDYKSRQRSVQKARTTFSPAFVFDDAELDEFLALYESIEITENYKMFVNWLVDGSDGSGKEIRVIQAPLVKPLGNFKYNVSIVCEILSYGTPAADTKPLVPRVILLPSETLYPSDRDHVVPSLGLTPSTTTLPA